MWNQCYWLAAMTFQSICNQYLLANKSVGMCCELLQQRTQLFTIVERCRYRLILNASDKNDHYLYDPLFSKHRYKFDCINSQDFEPEEGRGTNLLSQDSVNGNYQKIKIEKQPNLSSRSTRFCCTQFVCGRKAKQLQLKNAKWWVQLQRDYNFVHKLVGWQF